jgi:hypothetical protein
VQKNKVNVSLAELVSGSLGFFGSIDKTQIHHLGAALCELLGDLLGVSLETIFQAGELRPIGIQANSE